MSVFAPSAPQIWAMETRARRSQFRAGNSGAVSFRFVSSRQLAARNDVTRSSRPVLRYKALSGDRSVPGRYCADASDSRGSVFVHCVRGGRKRGPPAGRKPRPTPSRTARRWPTPATARAAIPPIPQSRSPAASGSIRRSAAIYSPNLTPDRDTGIGGWSDEDFYPRAARRRGARRLALLSGVPLSLFHQTDPPGHPGDPGLSRDADAGQQQAAAAGTALAAELSRR